MISKEIGLIEREYNKAVYKHPGKRHTAHEAYAYILEEVRELEKEVFQQEQDIEKMRIEAAHIIVTAIRFIQDIC